MVNDAEQLIKLLEYLITPNDEAEQTRFGVVVDDYIAIKKRIPAMTKEELIVETNRQLEPYGIEVDEEMYEK